MLMTCFAGLSLSFDLPEALIFTPILYDKVVTLWVNFINYRPVNPEQQGQL